MEVAPLHKLLTLLTQYTEMQTRVNLGNTFLLFFPHPELIIGQKGFYAKFRLFWLIFAVLR